MPDDALLLRLLVSRGLVPRDRLRALLAARPRGDTRPLGALLVAAGLVQPADLERLRRDVLGSGPPGTPPDPSPPGVRSTGAAAAETRPGELARAQTVIGAGRAPGAERPYAQGDAITLRPGLAVRCEGVLGEGGMGIVYLVRDPRLGRPAALKLIKGEARAVRVRRFRREMVITARLDHPGIPPVYESGATSLGQDYLLMRAVDGRSLASALERRGDDPAEPRGLLQALVKVAEAVAYAHSRGVIHRDLKPDNIMIGAYGEVLVMDWGLARDLAQTRAEDDAVRSELATLLDADRQLTQEGALLGTLGFMAPEQARREDVGPPADVFALGAVLACVLTGAPPVAGDTALTVLDRTCRGEVELPRARRAGVAPELDAIAARALAHDPARRYPGPAALADDLRAYLEGRPVSVYRYGPLAQTLRLARRHPAAFAALAVTGALSIVGGLAVARARASAAAAERLAAADAARDEARAAWGRLEAAPAPAAPGPGPAADPAARREALERRAARALGALTAAQRWHALAPTDPAAARARFDAALALGALAQATEQWALAAEAFGDAAGLGVDDARGLRLKDAVERARTAEVRRRVEEVRGLLDQAAAGHLAARPDGVTDAVYRIARYPDPAVTGLLAERLREVSRGLARALLELLREAEGTTPLEDAAGERPIAGLGDALAHLERAGLDPGDALPEPLAAALAAAAARLERRALAQALPRGQLRRATFLQLAGERQARALGARLDEARLCCEALGRLDDRAAALPALREYLAAEGDELRAVPAGLALCRLGGEEAARALHRALLRFGWGGPFADQVARLSPLLRDAAHALAAGDVGELVNRGNLRAAQGDLEGAIEDYTRALELSPGLPLALGNRGVCWLRLRRPGDALRDLDAAAAGPGATAEVFANRARARLDLDDAQGALEDAERALRLDLQLALAWSARGLARWRAGDARGAREDLDRAVAVDARQPRAWLDRAHVRAAQGDSAGAVADLTEALALDPRQPDAWSARGVARAASGDPLGGVDDLSRAVALAPGDAALWFNRAAIEVAAGRLDAALGDYTRALELDPSFTRAWTNRGDLHHRRGDLDLALADLDEALARDPRDAVALSDRGAIRLALEDEAGWEDLRGAVRLQPDAPMAHYRVAAASFQRGRYAEACDAFDRVVDLAPGHLAWRLARGWARLLAGRREQALEDLAAAAVDPALPKAAVWLAALRGERPPGLEVAARGDPPLRDVARFYLGRLDAPALLREAQGAGPSDPGRAARCVARAHLGLLAEAQGERAAAVEHYRAAAAEGLADLVEHRWAQGRLAALGEAP